MRAYSLDPVDPVARRGRGSTGSPRTLPRVPCVHPPGLARWILPPLDSLPPYDDNSQPDYPASYAPSPAAQSVAVGGIVVIIIIIILLPVGA